MNDKDLIEKICNLTCSKEDIDISTDDITYDTERPFKKYYNADTVIGAFNKYLCKAWDDRTFAIWCYLYNYIICGGFGCNANDDLNPLEKLLMYIISYDLDGLSFFDEFDYHKICGADVFRKWSEEYKNWDHILNTIDDWKGICAQIGPDAEFNQSQFVVVFNKQLKENMIIYADLCDATDDNEIFRRVTEEEFDKAIEELRADGYSLLSCHEDVYYSMLDSDDEDDDEDLED